MYLPYLLNTATYVMGIDRCGTCSRLYMYMQLPGWLLGVDNMEALDGGPQCHMLISRNGNVACPCRLFPPMSHVDFKKGCHMSI